jgi:hypothetical protein
LAGGNFGWLQGLGLGPHGAEQGQCAKADGQGSIQATGYR